MRLTKACTCRIPVEIHRVLRRESLKKPMTVVMVDCFEIRIVVIGEYQVRTEGGC